MPAGGLIAGGIAAVVGYAIAYTRRGSVRSGMSERRLEIQTPGDPDSVFAALVAIGPPYRVDDADRETRTAVLSSRPSLWSYGFLYPVIVHPAVPDGSRIELGVRSRFFHIGPGVGIAHLRCAKEIERLLTVPTARQIERA